MSSPLDLKPSLLTRDTFADLTGSDVALAVTLSPRANELAIHTQVSRERPVKGQALSQLNKSTLPNQETVWLAKWGATPPLAAALHSDAYITWASLQKYSLELKQEGLSVDTSQNIEGLNRISEMYLENTQAHIDRIALEKPFNQPAYTHWVSVHTSLHLFQTMLTSSSGMMGGLAGEEMLLWLNRNFVAVTKEEWRSLAGKQEPWHEEGFWPLLVRATIRCLSEGAVHFFKMLTSHPSLTLRNLAPQLQRILSSHPRSTSFATEQEFYTAHRRWKASVKGLREQLDVIQDAEEWREGLNDLVGVLEGDKDVILKVCDEDYGGFGWREAVSVWGIWVDVEIKRQDLPDILAFVHETLPVDRDPDALDQRVQAALVSQQLKRFVHLAADLDLWLGAHVCDLIAKLGIPMYATPISSRALQEIGGDLAEDLELGEFDETGAPRMTLRDHLVMDYAGQILHSDPSFWDIEFDYLAACGHEGRARLGAVLQRIAFDVSGEPTATQSKKRANGVLGGFMDEDDEDDLQAGRDLGRLTGMERVQKLVDVCKEYQLEDESRELCRVVSRRLVNERRYGDAIAYSKHAEDYKAVARIADLILDEYIEQGADEFLALVSELPGLDDPSFDPLYHNEDSIYGSRLSFLTGYAKFQQAYRDGKKREAAGTLISMLNRSIIPRWWWGVVLLDAAGMCEDEEMVFTEEDAYDLLRHVEEIYMRSQQGSGVDYLGALEKIMNVSRRTGDRAVVGSTSDQAIKQLEVVRLSLARYLARVFTSKM